MEGFGRVDRIGERQSTSLGELPLEIPQDDHKFERLGVPARPLDL